MSRYRRGVLDARLRGHDSEDDDMKSPRAFTHIDTWVFDLDNTLYPHHVNLWQQVDARIGEFVSAWLKVSAEEARVIQKDYYRRYGTTMRGMMTEHGVPADDYLAYVHKIDHSPLEPNPAMGAAIAKLPGRKLILTNGSTDHAGAVLARLGLAQHFEAVFDIIAAELEPKPAPQTYQKFLRVHGVDPPKSAMFEDLARNLVVPHQLGMTTVLVVPDGAKEVVREDWELEGRDAAYVDHVTDDLTGFLQKLARPSLGRHAPRRRGIQYAAAFEMILESRRTGSPAPSQLRYKAGDRG